MSNFEPPNLSFLPKSVAESTLNQSTQDSRNCQFYFDEKLNEILANLNLKGCHNSPSPDSYQFWPLLNQELEYLNQDSPQADFISSLAIKSKNHVFDVKEEFNFDTGQLNAQHLRKYGLSQNSLDILEKDITINCKAGSFLKKFDPPLTPILLTTTRLLCLRFYQCLSPRSCFPCDI